VIAGPDGLDPRQDAVSRPVDYLAALGLGAQGLRIGVLREGFGHPEANAGVEAKVRASAALLTRLGAIVEDVSVPMHALGPSLWLSIAAEGATEALMKGNVFGSGWRGLYVTSLRRAHAGWRARPHELSDSLKLLMLLGQYFSKHHSGRFYAKAQNISRALRAADADDAGHRPADPAAGCAPSAQHLPGAGGSQQHLAVQRDWPSGDLRTLRDERRPAGRHDARGQTSR